MKKNSLKIITLVCSVIFGITSVLTVNAGVELPSSNSVPFPCGKCLGEKTVKDIYGKRITCPRCLGSGNEPDQGQNDHSVKATSFPDVKKKCQECQGAKGWNTSYGWVTCNHCHGSGVEPNK